MKCFYKVEFYVKFRS